MRLAWPVVLAAAVAAWSGAARAGNAIQPRVPPTFLDPPCAELLGSATPDGTTLRIDVGLPLEDPTRTEDEPIDSRRFQFFALCRQPRPLERLPAWISADDVARARAANPALGEVGPEDVLETSSAWATRPDGAPGPCVREVIAADARIPITCDATRDPIACDVGAWPDGNYVIAGYTFTPIDNLWTLRPGVVQVRNQDRPPAPAVAFTLPTTEATVAVEAGVTIHGCAVGTVGTTVRLAWAGARALAMDPEGGWHPFAEIHEPAGAFEVAFVPPEQSLYEAVYVRADVEDPAGSHWTAYTLAPLVVVGGCTEPVGGTPARDDVCRPPSPDPALPAEAAEPCPGTDSDADEPGAPGSGCQASAPVPNTPACIAPLLPCLRRRRSNRSNSTV